MAIRFPTTATTTRIRLRVGTAMPTGDSSREKRRHHIGVIARPIRSSLWLPAIRPPVGLVERLGRPS